MKRDAVISDCGRYRYRLYREWEPTDKAPVLWLMLNPSTADASIDDPTIRRCISFSKAWGFGAMWVGNLFAIRSSDPGILTRVGVEEARGPENKNHLLGMAAQAALTVCAWGGPGGRQIPEALGSYIRAPGGIWCLGTTKHGAPRHPLYVPGRQERVPFPTTGAADG